MDTTEERLTGALDAAAETVRPYGVRPLREPRRSTRSPRRRNPWFAPAAAAGAMVVVVALALVVASGHHPQSPATPAGAVAAPSIGGAPKYYADVEGQYDGWHGTDSVEAVVRSTATGAVVARIKNPVISGEPKVLATDVAAAPGDRTFYVVYDDWSNSTGDYRIYSFHLTSSGKPTALAAVNGGEITGQDHLPSPGGFVVSPDGSQLALAVTTTSADVSAATVAGKMIVIDLRTGAQAVWQGGVARAGQVFGIQSLSWTGDGKSLVYVGQWCTPNNIVYGGNSGFVCTTNGNYQKGPVREGTEVLREVPVTSVGGSLDAGRVLLRPSDSPATEPYLLDPDGTDVITIADLPSSGFEVVKMSIATGHVTSVLGPVPGGIDPLFGADYLTADSTGNYVLIWTSDTSTTGPTMHGWVHAGAYHQLAPNFAVSYQGGVLQLAW